MINKSIPYLGIDSNILRETIFNSKILMIKEVDLYNFVISNIEHRLLVVIDNKWLTWLNDIQFNYRDKKCVIHYWKFDIVIEDKNIVKKDNYDYLLIDDENNFYIRYNYDYNEVSIKIGTELVIYDIEQEIKYKIIVKDYIDASEFDIDMLYRLYIESCYKDDSILNKHDKGNYYIDYSSKHLNNREQKLRYYYGLHTFKDYKQIEKLCDYRDVREYKRDEVQIQVGLLTSIESYKIRRLKFEAYLYCILRKQLKSNNENFNNNYSKLGKSKNIVKYGDSIKLIFKSYWLNQYNKIEYKTWMRFE